MIVSLETNLLTRLVHFRIFARVGTRRPIHASGETIFFCPFWTLILFSALMAVRTPRADAARVRETVSHRTGSTPPRNAP
ncbi:hypothetical protein DF057_05395 [Burkholderia cepacia]|nr:hypothetical protein DF057_05395 [Burkholderia cepacia]